VPLALSLCNKCRSYKKSSPKFRSKFRSVLAVCLPLPPPPPSGPKLVQANVQEQVFNGGYLADLQNYSRSALKRAEVVDKSDGKQAAISMLAQKKSKLKLKKATWTNEDDDAEIEV
jgi:hypothetical protein